ncbi:shugoshin 1 isoform X4 [Coturnix japonica]|uniref:Shugoshin 1 n=1 Tax=Coturnix japonica TaxID=93934 RepID=A0A8C2YBU0_COTJA|nr:shugoshin 1 isoform X4 [Coturnix japonica]
MAEHLKKPFKDSLSDIKERMKEKRNQKWVSLGKKSQISTVKCKRATTTSVKMKSLQANNIALAQALQEEKLKLRDAQALIIQLRREYQDLKFQMFHLQRSLAFRQAEGLVENQRVRTSELENNSSDVGERSSVELLLPADGDDPILQSRLEADCEKSEPGHSVFEICRELDSGTSLAKIIPDKGQTSDCPVYNIASMLGGVFSGGEDEFGNELTKNVSTRRHCSKMSNRDELYTGVLDHLKASDSAKEPFKQDEIRLEESLDVYTVENIHSGISQVDKVGSELLLRQTDSETAKVSSGNSSDLKQRACKSREDSQVRRGKDQKVKMGGTKGTSRPRSKKRQCKETSKEKLGGSSDAYDFNFEESIHVTPFRQNKVNDADTDVDDKEESSESNSSKLSDTEEDSDDSLYVPHRNKSKKRKSSVDGPDSSPIHVRPRSKRCLAQREQKLHKEETEKKTEIIKSSEKSIRQSSKSFHGHLCDVTNIASLLSKENAPVGPAGERSPSPKRNRRSCTLSVNYKEPSIAGKLRRGDPFTDVCFLNSPIFKQKKNAKHNSTKKKSLSEYNEKFVSGC